MLRTGGEIVVESLLANGVDQIFGVPGESYLPILDALFDFPEVRLTIARQEGSAAMMAEAYGKLTGRPGICLVTRGPGAANAYSGIHVAAQDSTPLIVLMGQVARNTMDREAFQEVDVKAMFGGQVKWAAQVNDAARLPEYIARAFSCAMSGRPGPVVLALPEDVLSGQADVPAASPAVVAAAAPAPQDMDFFARLLTSAERPLLIVGGEHWKAEDCERLVRLSEQWCIPVACAFRSQDRFPNTHPNYAGDAGLGINPALAKRIREADMIIALGARLGDCTTSSYTLLESPQPSQRLVHIHADPEELGRVYQPELAINSSVSAFLRAAEALVVAPGAGWAEHVAEAHAGYQAWTDSPTSVPGDFNLGEAVVWLRDNLPEDAILTNGAGNYTVWLHRYYRHRRYRTQLAPTSGSMGYGLPAGIAAKLRHPERAVIALAGDGCFQMTCQELGTVAENGLKLIVLVVNNGMYGTIRMHQENHYPRRTIGTNIRNPDFVAVAKAYGLKSERVTHTDAFPAAMERALKADVGTLIEIVTDPRILTPTRHLAY